ncbi:MAG: hypothetical protein ACI9FJ_002836 [Alteromonadaceae bacterium]|jgi:hypothetical protein
MDITTKEISDVLGITKRTIQRQSNSEHWPYRLASGIGGTHRVFDFVVLAGRIKTRFVDCLVNKLGPVALASLLAEHHYYDPQLIVDDTKETAVRWLTDHSFALGNATLSAAQLNDTIAIRTGILSLAWRFAEQLGKGKINGFDTFAQQYSAHAFAIQPGVYEARPKVSRISLLRWAKADCHGGKPQVPVVQIGDQTFEMLLKQKLVTQDMVVSEHQIERLIQRLKMIRFDIQKYKRDGAGLKGSAS